MHTYRKHCFAYLPAAFRIVVVVFILYVIFYFNGAAEFLQVVQIPSFDPIYKLIYTWGNLVIAFIVMVPLLIDLYRLFLLHSTYIRVDSDTVYYHSGIFPWSTHTQYWRPFQIFSSSYKRSGFFGWLFSYGNVIITGKEGVTTHFEATAMWRPEQSSIDINQLVRG
jgi:hypothetical protein